MQSSRLRWAGFSSHCKRRRRNSGGQTRWPWYLPGSVLGLAWQRQRAGL